MNASEETIFSVRFRRPSIIAGRRHDGLRTLVTDDWSFQENENFMNVWILNEMVTAKMTL